LTPTARPWWSASAALATASTDNRQRFVKISCQKPHRIRAVFQTAKQVNPLGCVPSTGYDPSRRVQGVTGCEAMRWLAILVLYWALSAAPRVVTGVRTRRPRCWSRRSKPSSSTAIPGPPRSSLYSADHHNLPRRSSGCDRCTAWSWPLLREVGAAESAGDLRAAGRTI
jgi:hypothetical protein